jgi:hypothetical protein
MTDDKSYIDNLVKTFFRIFTNANQQQPDWEIIHHICIPQTIIIKKSDLKEEVYNLQTFIAPRKIILSDGTLSEFEEKETGAETKIAGNIAQRFSTYQKSGFLNGKWFEEYGNKIFQFIKTNAGWKISAVVWEDEKK